MATKRKSTMKTETMTARKQKPALIQQSGRLWFSRETERRFYFVLTLFMLGAGILYKLGVI